MKIKSTVRFKEINKYGVRFFATVLTCELELGLPITLTSANDSIHRPRSGRPSFHGQDKAWDIRINDITHEEAEERRAFLEAELGYGWDICIERFPDNPANDHIHVERDTTTYPEVKPECPVSSIDGFSLAFGRADMKREIEEKVKACIKSWYGDYIPEPKKFFSDLKEAIEGVKI